MSSDKTVTGYMCMVDWDWELGNASGGNKVYPSIEDLKRCHTCWEECGIVEVEVRMTKVIVDEKPIEWNKNET